MKKSLSTHFVSGKGFFLCYMICSLLQNGDKMLGHGLCYEACHNIFAAQKLERLVVDFIRGTFVQNRHKVCGLFVTVRAKHHGAATGLQGDTVFMACIRSKEAITTIRT